MGLPTTDKLQKLNYNYLGQPFCWLSTKRSLDTDTLDYQYFGQPFWAIMLYSVPTELIYTVPAEQLGYTVPKEESTYTVPAGDLTYTVPKTK